VTTAIIVGSVLSTVVSVGIFSVGLAWLNRRIRRMERGLSAAVEVFVKRSD